MTTCTRSSTTTSGSTAATPTASPSRWRSTTPTAASWPSSSTATTRCPTRSSGRGCAPSTCRRCMPGTDADLVAAFTPIALEVDAPGDVPRETARRQPHRAAVVPEHAARGGVGARRSPSTGAGSRRRARAPSWLLSRSSRPSRARTPTPTSSGPTSRGTCDTPCGTTVHHSAPGQDLHVGDDEDRVGRVRPATERVGDRLELGGRRSARTRAPARRSASSGPGRPTARPTTPASRGRRTSRWSSRRSRRRSPASCARPSRRGPIRASCAVALRHGEVQLEPAVQHAGRCGAQVKAP